MTKQPELPDLIRDMEIVKSLNRSPQSLRDPDVDAEAVDTVESSDGSSS
jgi:hypothetical protein